MPVTVKLPFHFLYVCTICGFPFKDEAEAVQCESKPRSGEIPEGMQVGSSILLSDRKVRCGATVLDPYCVRSWEVVGFNYACPGERLKLPFTGTYVSRHELCITLVGRFGATPLIHTTIADFNEWVAMHKEGEVARA